MLTPLPGMHMVATRTKIAWSLVVVLAGAAAALVFRKPSPPAAYEETHAAAAARQPAETQARIRPRSAGRSRTTPPASGDAPSPGNVAAPVRGHLLGRIDVAPEPAPAQSPPSAPAGPSHMADNSARPLQPANETNALEPKPAGGPRVVKHRVRDGDTLTFLALRYLGAAHRYLEIYEYNRDRLPSPDLLPLGVELEISLERGEALTSTSLAAEEAPLVPIPAVAHGRRTRAVSARLGDPADAPTRTYRMRAGETLADVARHLLGDAALADLLYQVNRDRLRSPQDVQEGVLLVLPGSEEQLGR